MQKLEKAIHTRGAAIHRAGRQPAPFSAGAGIADRGRRCPHGPNRSGADPVRIGTKPLYPAAHSPDATHRPKDPLPEDPAESLAERTCGQRSCRKLLRRAFFEYII